ncbi:MAG: hypothetical protein U1F65_05675 [Verrucomicrobiota bacterium]
MLHPWEAFNGVNTGHYLLYDEAVQAAQGVPIYYHPNGKTFADTNDTGRYIYMPTEFMHGLFDGGAGAGLDDYWRMMSASKFLGGGFIWVLTDDGVKRPDTGEIDVAGNQAPDGIVGPYRQREGSFYAIKEIWSPIQVIRDGEATFKVQNHYSFTDARQCQFTAELRWLGNPDTAKGRLSSVPAVVEVPAIAPGGTGTVRVRLPRTRTQPDVLALRVNNPQGRELWTWTCPLTTKNRATALYHEPAEQRAVPTETSEAIRVTAGGLTVAFSKQTGLLTEVQRNGQAFSLTNGPLPAVGGATLTKLTWDQDGPDAVVSAKFSGAMKSVFWRVNGNGWVQCDYKYEATGTNDYFGVLFDYPEHLVKHKRWLGDGPFRVWKNRQRGVTLDVWENDYNDTLAGYRGWNYPEFKGFFANVRWFQLQTAEGQLTVVNNNNNAPFVQIFPPTFPPTNLVGKAFARVPGGGLGLLDAIPPIGSKFKDANTTGPQGQPTIGRGEYSGSVSFYFGKL